MLLKPKEVEIETPEGPKTYIISCFSAIAGREIISQYPMSGLPKLGDYATNEALMLKIMAHVAVPMPENAPPCILDSRALVDNHVSNWEDLAKLEWEMLKYNCSFMRNGQLSSFLDDLLAKLPASILSMLTPLLERSLQKDEQPSES